MRRIDRGDRGFTLIELLVVMIIIGILAAIAIPVFLNQRENGYRTTLRSDLRAAATAVESFAVDNGGGYGGIVAGTQLPSSAPAIPFAKSNALVTVTVKSATATGYCIEAVHQTLTAERWHWSNGAGTPERGTC